MSRACERHGRGSSADAELPKMFSRCVRTVCEEIKSVAAISELVSPRATQPQNLGLTRGKAIDAVHPTTRLGISTHPREVWAK